MKKSLLVLLVLLATAGSSFAQRFAYVNTDYILGNIPAFEEAQKQVDEISKQWVQRSPRSRRKLKTCTASFRMNSTS